MSNSRGVAVLFNNNFEFKVLQQVNDINGNFLALDIIIEGKQLSLITLYGPNEDTPRFYEKKSDIISNLNNNNIIIVGDYNLVLNPERDYHNYLHVNNPRSREKVFEVLTTFNLLDAYREFHPDVNRYTWRKHNPIKQSRLDFFLNFRNFTS